MSSMTNITSYTQRIDEEMNEEIEDLKKFIRRNYNDILAIGMIPSTEQVKKVTEDYMYMNCLEMVIDTSLMTNDLIHETLDSEKNIHYHNGEIFHSRDDGTLFQSILKEEDLFIG